MFRRSSPSFLAIHYGVVLYLVEAVFPFFVWTPNQHEYLTLPTISGVVVLCCLLAFPTIVVTLFVLLTTYVTFTTTRNRQEPDSGAAELYSRCVENERIRLMAGYDVYLPPKQSTPSSIFPMGMLFFPGALVSKVAYAEIAHQLSNEGIVVVIVDTDPTRLPCPILGCNMKTVLSIFHTLQNRHQVHVAEWSLGGHSMGAFVAAKLWKDRISLGTRMEKLVLWGVYRLYGLNLSKSNGKILVMQASNDGFYYKSETEKSSFLELCPPQHNPNPDSSIPPNKPSLFLHEIIGGNHSGFGSYGPQMFPVKEGKRTIPLSEQHEQVVKTTAKFLL